MSAQAVRVAPEWLELREPADAAARSAELAQRLASRLPATRPLVIHDLGGGSGAMGRWLAPRLPGPQHWVVHDRDERLLRLAVARPPQVAGVTVEGRPSDITRLAPDDLAGADAIVASALLDVLTADELTTMLDRCLAAGCPVLFALTVVGRVAVSPMDPLDTRIEAAFNAHQRREGRLGPDAVAAAVAAVGGAEVLVRPSPWRLGAVDAELTAEWLGGWVTAACEQEPVLRVRAGLYLDRRLARAAAGQLDVTVAHADLLVLP
jgi:hypothetical protein